MPLRLAASSSRGYYSHWVSTAPTTQRMVAAHRLTELPGPLTAYWPHCQSQQGSFLLRPLPTRNGSYCCMSFILMGVRSPERFPAGSTWMSGTLQPVGMGFGMSSHNSFRVLMKNFPASGTATLTGGVTDLI